MTGGASAQFVKVSLPDHDGDWLIRQVRGLKPESGGDIPVIAIGVDAADRERCLSHGFQAYFTWPLNPWEFSCTIAALTIAG